MVCIMPCGRTNSLEAQTPEGGRIGGRPFERRDDAEKSQSQEGQTTSKEEAITGQLKPVPKRHGPSGMAPSKEE